MLLLSQDEVLLLNESEVWENQPSLSVSLKIPLCLILLLFKSKMSLTCFVKTELEGICISPWF